VPLREDDRIKEQIRFNTEVLKLIIVGFLATSGGVLSLVVTRGSTAVENLFTAGGMIIVIVIACVIAMIRTYKRIQTLIDNGNE
jgi:hypothetical protein